MLIKRINIIIFNKEVMLDKSQQKKHISKLLEQQTDVFTRRKYCYIFHSLQMDCNIFLPLVSI